MQFSSDSSRLQNGGPPGAGGAGAEGRGPGAEARLARTHPSRPLGGSDAFAGAGTRAMETHASTLLPAPPTRLPSSRSSLLGKANGPAAAAPRALPALSSGAQLPALPARIVAGISDTGPLPAAPLEPAVDRGCAAAGAAAAVQPRGIGPSGHQGNAASCGKRGAALFPQRARGRRRAATAAAAAAAALCLFAPIWMAAPIQSVLRLLAALPRAPRR